jgi:hypothetical protein
LDLVDTRAVVPNLGRINWVRERVVDVRHLLVGLLLLTSAQSVANGRCLDEATARLGYKFQDSQGGIGEVQFNGAQQTVVTQRGGREVRQTFANDGQVMTESSGDTGKGTVHQLITFQATPVLLDSVGQSDQYGSIARSDGGGSGVAYTFTRRRVTGVERVSIEDCSYDTLIIAAEIDLSGDVVLKITSKTNWSPVLAKFVKAEITAMTPPDNKPIVTNFALVRVGF